MVAMSVYCLFLSFSDETVRMWLFLSYHSRWVVRCISRLPPSAFESCARTVKIWQSMCRNDYGGCHRGWWMPQGMVDATGDLV